LSQVGDESSERHAPAPAMYWSHPKTYGTIPPQVRAHASVVYEERMFVFGGSTKSQQCLDTLYTLDLGSLSLLFFMIIYLLSIYRYIYMVKTSHLWTYTTRQSRTLPHRR
jgi:hypothetical protein